MNIVDMSCVSNQYSYNSISYQNQTFYSDCYEYVAYCYSDADCTVFGDNYCCGTYISSGNSYSVNQCMTNDQSNTVQTLYGESFYAICNGNSTSLQTCYSQSDCSSNNSI
jgi:hypothetical protein